MGLWAEQSSAPRSPGLATAPTPPIEADNPASSVPIVYLCGAGPTGKSSTKLLSFPVFTLRAFPCVLGRHPECEHRLVWGVVSRRHCEFTVRGGQVWVEDLGSRHGTRLNGEPVEGLQPLRDWDRLHLAYLGFTVRLGRRSGS
jgi:pSer/pThr/pTyr-binding forkhead associated (FHA) protein